MVGWGTTHSSARKGLAGLLAALYVVLTVTALNCGVAHALAGAHCDMAMGPGKGAMANPAGQPHPGADARLAQSLCNCLDVLSAHGPAVVALALPAPATEPVAVAPRGAVIVAAPIRPDAPRGPPFSA